ncbi:MAG: 30S ribosomal protein S4 [bacterium]|nr:30S ribosomal protein S4 [bacterium]
MARYRGPKHKISRRFGMNIFETDKDPLEKRPYPPGQHGRTRRRKVSEYGLQLTEKQKVKYIYGVLEKQFRNYFKEAARRKGVTGTNLMQMLECRLDNVVFRCGFAATRPQARQLVNHRHFLVNDHIVDIASFQVKPGDKIVLREKSRKNVFVLESLKKRAARGRVTYINVDEKAYSGEMISIPERDDIPVTVQEQLIVELYSK